MEGSWVTYIFRDYPFKENWYSYRLIDISTVEDSAKPQFEVSDRIQ